MTAILDHGRRREIAQRGLARPQLALATRDEQRIAAISRTSRSPRSAGGVPRPVGGTPCSNIVPMTGRS
ncbi:hypothetical protein [Diaminobutyricibacter sp. McL0608]|uniref:hypothetical protein n=1 Tax=Leifsonia sp. McL0608 TaxID=3143537 RepID=UPI0031F3294D